jgi:hypothetical protein
MQRLFIIAWSAVVIVLIALMVMLYVSLVPHFVLIGDIAFVVLCVFLTYGVILGGYGTYHLICTWNLNRKVIVRGEVVAYLDRKNNTFTHLSAQHEQAKFPQYVIAAKEEKLDPRDEDIIEVYNDGVSTLEQIADSFGLKYHRVQSIVAHAKKQGLIHRK